MSISADNKDYWNTFYNSSQALNHPSQFAAFAASFLRESDLLVDLGCGNGRDSIFLSQYVKKIVAIDKSNVATEKLNSLLKTKNGEAIVHSFGEDDNHKLKNKIINEEAQRIFFYSRFFFHSIDNPTQNFVFDFIKMYGKQGDICCFEFRTAGDECREKIYKGHQRRYVDFPKFIKELESLGVEVIYQVEATGLAYFKGEDPLVGRVLCEIKRQ